MDFLSPRSIENPCGIADIDSTPGHDDDAACRLAYQIFQQGNAIHGIGSLATGENTMKPEADKLFKGMERLTTYIESTMKGQRDRTQLPTVDAVAVITLPNSGLHETPACRNIHIAVGGKGTYHHPVRSGSSCKKNIAHDDILLFIIVQKITGTRTDKDVMPDSSDFQCGFYQSKAGSDSALCESGTEFNTISSTLDCTMHA